MSDFHIIIPARYASVRLPGKLLLELSGKTVIQRTYEQACQSNAKSVLIATDEQRIFDHMQSLGANVCMTDANHVNGSARIAEAARSQGFADDDIVLNVQGDEPLIPPQIINQVADNLRQHRDAQVATLCCEIHDDAELFNPNVVKVVFDKQGYALYFTRAVVPWEREHYTDDKRERSGQVKHFRHIGIYAYRTAYLQQYVNAKHSPLEQAEHLEQLRVLWHGDKIHVAVASEVPLAGIDTAEDLQVMQQYLDSY